MCACTTHLLSVVSGRGKRKAWRLEEEILWPDYVLEWAEMSDQETVGRLLADLLNEEGLGERSAGLALLHSASHVHLPCRHRLLSSCNESLFLEPHKGHAREF